jgi:hypothetical protein
LTRSSTHVGDGDEIVTFETSLVVESKTLKFEDDV